MGAPAPHFSGKNTKILLFIRGTKVGSFDVMSWEVGPVGTQVADGVCGEDRDRLDFIIGHYSLSLTGQEATTKTLNALLAMQREIDLNVTIEESAIVLQFKPNDGTQAAYQARQAVFDDWRLRVGGRAERGQKTIPIRARYFEPLPTS